MKRSQDCYGLFTLRMDPYMKYMLMLFVFFTTSSVHANTNQCLLLNGDSKHACLANRNKSMAECMLIKDPDAKNQCMAAISGKKIYCDLIRDQKMKVSCRAN